jgi:hypothetical protein
MIVPEVIVSQVMEVRAALTLPVREQVAGFEVLNPKPSG